MSEHRQGEGEKRRREEEKRSEEASASSLQPSVLPSSPTPNTEYRTPSSCDRVASELKAYQDGQLGWWARRNVERHLAHCAHCREEMEAMREFSDVLREGDAEPLSPQLRARILAAVPDMPPSPVSKLPAVRHVRRPVLAWGAAASALVVGVVLYPLYQNAQHVSRANAPMASLQNSQIEKNASSVAGSAPGGMPATATSDAASSKTTAPAQIAMGSRTAAGGMPGGTMRDYNREVDPVSSDIATPDSGKVPMMAAIPPRATANEVAKPTPPVASPPAPADGHYYGGTPRPASGHSSGSFAGAGAAAPAMKVTPTAPGVASRKVEDKHAVPKGATAAKNVARRSTGSTTSASDVFLLVVTDVEQSQAAINRTVQQNGGIVSTVKSPGETDKEATITLTLKLPPDHRSAFVSQLGALGELQPGANVQSTKGAGKSSPAADATLPNEANSNSQAEKQSQRTAAFRAGMQQKPKVSAGKTARAESGAASHAPPGNTSRRWTQLTIHLRQR